MSTLPLRLIVAAYCLSGMPYGVVSETLPAFMRFGGHSLREVGLLGLMQLPWSVKFLWGPLIDRTGRVRLWFGGSVFLLTATYLGLSALPATAPSRQVFLLAFCLSAVASVLDVTLDGMFVRLLFVRRLNADQIHRVNGLRLASYKAALALGGGVTLYIGTSYGFRAAFTLLAATTFCLYLAVPHEELAQVRVPRQSLRAWGKSLLPWVRAPGAKGAFALIFFYKLSIATLLGLEKPFWVDRGLSGATIGFASSFFGMGGTVVGALFGSHLANRLGEARALRVGILLQTIPALSYLLVQALALPSGYILPCAFLSSLVLGISTAILLSFITRICDAAHAATQFAALTATYALTRSFGSLVGGFCAEQLGYAAFFAVATLAAFPALAWLPSARLRLDALVRPKAVLPVQP